MLAAQRSLHPVLSCCLCTASGNLSAQVCVPVPVYSVSRLYVVFTINFITFPHVPLTFLHVPPWLSKRSVDISYVPIRSEQPLRSFRKRCTQIIRSYTFCATLPQIRKNMYSNHTFLYVLCNPPTNSKKLVLKSYVPIRSEQPSRSSCLISYVPSRSAAEFEKSYRFPYVPKRSVQQYRKILFEVKN